MNKKTIITILLAIIAIAGQAKQKTVVWEKPTTEYGTCYGDGFFTLALDITKVELKETETIVYITTSQRSDYPNYCFKFAGDTYLKVGKQRYPIISADGIELNKFMQTDRDGKRKLAFHFPPLPQSTRSFDFIEGDGDRAFQIKGIKPVEERWNQLFPSYWRDNEGNWQIAFFEDCAIYDCKFWSYKECDLNHITGEAKIVIQNADKELSVRIGKDKKGKRLIEIGGEKANYSMITSRFLPDYPSKDTREEFANNGYKTDIVTVVGWIKDMPALYKKEKTFELGYTNLLTGEPESVNANLDSLGRFTVKIPVLNSTEFFCDWKRCFIRTILEPGKTYFILYDFKEGRRYFMGEDCHLQNELFKYPLRWESVRMEHGGDFNRFITSTDSLIKAQYTAIDELCNLHPTLSTRFYKYQKGNTLWQQARNFGQARFSAPNFKLPDNASKYVYDNFWTKREHPYTLHRDFRYFLCDYLDDVTGGLAFSYNVMDDIDEIASNEKESTLLHRWKNCLKEAQAEMDAACTEEEKKRIAEKINADNSEMIEQATAILNGSKAQRIIGGKTLIIRLKSYLHKLDSLNADQLVKDIWLMRTVGEEIDYKRTAVIPEVLDTLKVLTANPIAIESVEKQNNRYLAIENREFNKLVLKSADNLADLSEGEALLKKILEPYKGKFVLLDIWGTWCNPCKQALSHSTQEYARLKNYDIQYLYLANRSPQDSWENVIKEYNVIGDNVAHYNLPDKQQAAIERYLGIRSFPTYKLFNRDGKLIDLKVDPRQLDSLVRLLEQMK